MTITKITFNARSEVSHDKSSPDYELETLLQSARNQERKKMADVIDKGIFFLVVELEKDENKSLLERIFGSSSSRKTCIFTLLTLKRALPEIIKSGGKNDNKI